MRSQFYGFVKIHVALSVHIEYQFHSDTQCLQPTFQKLKKQLGPSIKVNRARRKSMKSALSFVCCINTRQWKRPRHLKTIISLFLNFTFTFILCNFINKYRQETIVFFGYFMKSCGVEDAQLLSFQTAQLSGISG